MMQGQFLREYKLVVVGGGGMCFLNVCSCAKRVCWVGHGVARGHEQRDKRARGPFVYTINIDIDIAARRRRLIWGIALILT